MGISTSPLKRFFRFWNLLNLQNARSSGGSSFLNFVAMRTEDLGFNKQLEQFRMENKLSENEIGRVVAEHKERYVVMTTAGEFEAEITGNMRFAARSREDLPAVGDWVALTIYEGDLAIIHKILPRFSVLKRQSVGYFGEVQVIAANIDFAFLVQAADRDFNLNRLERYLTLCYSAKVEPIIVLTKTDLVDEVRMAEIMERIKNRIPNVLQIAVSNETHAGYEKIKKTLEKGKTYCMLGSSGVGKSTLINNLSGKTILETGPISLHTGKGRHVTTHRELVLLENGAIMIDNPGMREVGIADSAGGLETAFDQMLSFSEHCKFKDCTHTQETGCAVLEALEKGNIDRDAYENYLKLAREKAHFETSAAEKRKKEKIFGRIIKDYNKKDIKKRKP